MRKFILFIILGSFSVSATAQNNIYKSTKKQNCLEKTFYSVHSEYSNILCSRGQDCSKAKDKGLKFSNCSIEYWKGDTGIILNYKIKDNIIIFLARYPSQESKFLKNEYILSNDGTTITNSKAPEETYKTKPKM
jgi:hypothetical protein